MAKVKYDFPFLDCDTRFSLWQVMMRDLLAQLDYNDALVFFGGKTQVTWNPDEINKD